MMMTVPSATDCTLPDGLRQRITDGTPGRPGPTGRVHGTAGSRVLRHGYRTIAAVPRIMLVDGAPERRQPGGSGCCERSWTRRSAATRKRWPPWFGRAAAAAASG